MSDQPEKTKGADEALNSPAENSAPDASAKTSETSPEDSPKAMKPKGAYTDSHPRMIKFGDDTYAALKVLKSSLKSEYPKITFSMIVKMAVIAFAKGTTAAPRVQFAMLAASEIIRLQGILADAALILDQFRSDLIKAAIAGNRKRMIELADAAEAAIKTIKDVSYAVAKLAKVPPLTATDHLNLEQLVAQLKTDAENATDTGVKRMFELGLQLLTPFLK